MRTFHLAWIRSEIRYWIFFLLSLLQQTLFPSSYVFHFPSLKTQISSPRQPSAWWTGQDCLDIRVLFQEARRLSCPHGHGQSLKSRCEQVVGCGKAQWVGLLNNQAPVLPPFGDFLHSLGLSGLQPFEKCRGRTWKQLHRALGEQAWAPSSISSAPAATWPPLWSFRAHPGHHWMVPAVRHHAGRWQYLLEPWFVPSPKKDESAWWSDCTG